MQTQAFGDVCTGNVQVVALIATEVHARDVTERLHHVSARGTSDFAWSKQLRFYWSREANECVVKQVKMQLGACAHLFSACSQHSPLCISNVGLVFLHVRV